MEYGHGQLVLLNMSEMQSETFAGHLAYNYGDRFRIPKKAENPFKMGYVPELDTSPQLDPDLTIICILRWMINQVRISIITKVSLLSFY